MKLLDFKRCILAFFDDILLLRVDASEEFAPIKDFTDISNTNTAKEKYEGY